jgi:hypothetical protein
MRRNNQYILIVILPILLLTTSGCSLFFDSDNEQIPTVTVEDKSYLNTSTLRVEVVNTTATPIYVNHLSFYFDLNVDGKWVEEYAAHKITNALIDPKKYLDKSHKILESVNLNEYDFREGEYRLRMEYRKAGTEPWLFAPSNSFVLLVRE